MKSMNDTMFGRVKEKAAEVVSDVLIHQANESIKTSHWFMFSEAKTPVELMMEDAQ